jgi:hypothetical protein
MMINGAEYFTGTNMRLPLPMEIAVSHMALRSISHAIGPLWNALSWYIVA